MCSRPFRPLGFAHPCRSRPGGSVRSLLPSSLYLLCRSSHSLHSSFLILTFAYALSAVPRFLQSQLNTSKIEAWTRNRYLALLLRVLLRSSRRSFGEDGSLNEGGFSSKEFLNNV